MNEGLWRCSPPALTWQLSESPAQSLIELIPDTGAPPAAPLPPPLEDPGLLPHTFTATPSEAEVEELRPPANGATDEG